MFVKICVLVYAHVRLFKPRGFFRRAGGRTPPWNRFLSPEISDKKRIFNFLTRKMACFSGKIRSNFYFSPPGKFHFLPFPTWKTPEKNPVNRIIMLIFPNISFSSSALVVALHYPACTYNQDVERKGTFAINYCKS